MAEQLANNAATTLNGNHNNSTTTIAVTDGSVFPSTGNFRILIGSELMLVTARSTNNLTVTRGAEGTTAVSHSDLDAVGLCYTRDSLQQIIADYESSGGYSSRPSSPRTGTVYTATDMNGRWRYNGSSWDMLWPIYVPNSKKWSTSGWTTQNQSTGTFTDQNGTLVVTTMPVNNNALRGYSKSMPSTPYKATWICGANVQAAVSMGIYIGHRENSSGKLKMMFNVANAGGIIGIEKWNNFSSFNSQVLSSRASYKGRVTWNRVENDGTNFKYYTSFDGKNYSLLYSEAKTDWFTTAADQIFFGFFTGTQYATNETGAFYLYGYWEE